MNLICHMIKSPQKYRQRGVNLIEIMVAMTIGLFLVLGATTLYVNSQQTSDVDDQIARLNETARYAMSTLESDIRMANYWGLIKDSKQFINKRETQTMTCGSNTNATETYATDVETYIEATNGPGISSCAAYNSYQLEADTLTIRRASTATVSSSSSASTQLRTCTTRNSAKIITDTTCDGGEIHELVVNGYYINKYTDTSTTPNTFTYSLRRKSLIAGPAFTDVEVIPGVEDMQIELGCDNSNADSDSAATVSYIPPPQTSDCKKIVSVRAWLLIRSEKPDYTFTDTRKYNYASRVDYGLNDHYRRILLSRTIYIRNALGT